MSDNTNINKNDLFLICSKCLPLSTTAVANNTTSVTITRNSNNNHTCKICTNPYTSYTTNNPTRTTTNICVNCARYRNICQICLLDMILHIPIQLRDEIVQKLGIKSNSIVFATTNSAVTDKLTKRYIAEREKLQLESSGEAVSANRKLNYDDIAKKISEYLAHNKKGNNNDKPSLDLRSNSNNKPFVLGDISNKSIKSVLLFLIKQSTLLKSTKDNSCSKYFIYNINVNLPEWAILESFKSSFSTVKDVSTFKIIFSLFKPSAKCGLIQLDEAINIIHETQICFQCKSTNVYVLPINDQDNFFTDTIKTLTDRMTNKELNTLGYYIDKIVKNGATIDDNLRDNMKFHGKNTNKNSKNTTANNRIVKEKKKKKRNFNNKYRKG
ncbi:uncharacterized protein SCODWIG_03336 [Saccharomycodes ludwigii]|uniref:Pre-mRNA-splicing factor SLT11 n=1 Tax=Saccharomycodes ludwigii TaxID=36035 RepID=A0A376BA68_9ASCO|nr:hypothetical protein SCDLUD_003705 [Saccharomycodes ludwigii]KAH3900704.1 hypothetical protein SCDLUD_003705 [Saccharomycodes ludwigii]SSD61575.1 uncharacterized protein SCODWIG_03336 [Saccharomycodes ludwigii]